MMVFARNKVWALLLSKQKNMPPKTLNSRPRVRRYAKLPAQLLFLLFSLPLSMPLSMPLSLPLSLPHDWLCMSQCSRR